MLACREQDGKAPDESFPGYRPCVGARHAVTGDPVRRWEPRGCRAPAAQPRDSASTGPRRTGGRRWPPATRRASRDGGCGRERPRGGPCGPARPTPGGPECHRHRDGAAVADPTDPTGEVITVRDHVRDSVRGKRGIGGRLCPGPPWTEAQWTLFPAHVISSCGGRGEEGVRVAGKWGIANRPVPRSSSAVPGSTRDPGSSPRDPRGGGGGGGGVPVLRLARWCLMAERSTGPRPGGVVAAVTT